MDCGEYVPSSMFECRDCKTMTRVYDAKHADMTCTSCGLSEHATIHSAYTQPMAQRHFTMQRRITYEKANHFSEWLLNVTAKCALNAVPERVIEQMEKEVTKLRLKKDEITPKIIRMLLKKNKLPKYYEHCIAISRHFNDRSAVLKLTDDEFQLLRERFAMLQAPFERHKENRKNFLSYSYTIFKLLELQGRDDVLEYIPFLKSHAKILQHDEIWQNMCRDLEWQYIPTNITQRGCN